MKELFVRWIGQSGYLLFDGETEICIDPYLSNVVDRLQKRGRMVEAPFPPTALKSNLVVCTHNHLDHVDIDAIPEMPKDNMMFLAPKAAEEALRACGVLHYTPFNEGDSYKVGDFTLTATFAEHSCEAIGLLVRHGDLTLYFSGDTLYNERLFDLAKEKVDVSFICINGKLGNMNAEQAVRLTRVLSPRLAVPTHYGMFESNTVDPSVYTDCLPNACALAYNEVYSLKALLDEV